ncbi:hypothetical protein H0I23_16445 [Cellulophaga sp. HaHaR_3_176]|uniref:hypothetical protein n=1 Tax=Cellulophaga sp. HaHaR_3_176 TaxID=1942464 RepID=UPI001C1FEAED|nr:hypothetical protein [Cellulophaga sp. HaHaR_3_176]QWX84014.1 hypothetical protein H0I23_16445 [Cellulophaga sp. HaHaR_3_176]
MKTVCLIIFSLFSVYFSLANVSVVNGLTHVYSGASGDLITGEVILINYSSVEQRVKFKIGEAIYSCNESRIFSFDKTHEYSSSAWINSNVNERVLAPKEQYVLKFTIQIPKDEVLRGSFWSVLMVSVDNPIKEEMFKNEIGLNTKIQYAVGLITNVNTVDDVNIDFNEVKSNKALNDSKDLKISMKNNGLFSEAVTLTLEVYNQQGTKIKEYKSRRLLVFPSLCRDYQINISDLPKGEYECVLLADARESFIGTNVKLNID